MTVNFGSPPCTRVKATRRHNLETTKIMCSPYTSSYGSPSNTSVSDCGNVDFAAQRKKRNFKSPGIFGNRSAYVRTQNCAENKKNVHLRNTATTHRSCRCHIQWYFREDPLFTILVYFFSNLRSPTWAVAFDVATSTCFSLVWYSAWIHSGVTW